MKNSEIIIQLLYNYCTTKKIPLNEKKKKNKNKKWLNNGNEGIFLYWIKIFSTEAVIKLEYMNMNYTKKILYLFSLLKILMKKFIKYNLII